MPYHWKSDNELQLTVIHSPLIIRFILFLFSFCFFVFPTLGMLMSIVAGSRFSFAYLIGIGLFSLMGFYLLRVSLWNTYGTESLVFSKDRITYEADYGWFRDGRKSIASENVEIHFNLIAYEDDQEGSLYFHSDQEIFCVVKMKKSEVERCREEIYGRLGREDKKVGIASDNFPNDRNQVKQEP